MVRHIVAPVKDPAAQANAAQPMNAPVTVAVAARRTIVAVKVLTLLANAALPMSVPEVAGNAVRRTIARVVSHESVISRHTATISPQWQGHYHQSRRSCMDCH